MSLYLDFPTFLRRHFPGKVQKISLDAGFTCPNRDGTRGWGGCTYCNNQTFNPDYCRQGRSITAQLEEGKQYSWTLTFSLVELYESVIEAKKKRLAEGRS